MSGLDKVKSLGQLKRISARLRRQGRTVVWTNGCFDLLHVGHVRYLREARGLGDALIVGLNSDKSVRRLKGAKRPLVPERERAEVLGGLAAVDFIVLYDDPTPDRLIVALRPDIHVKGGDYGKKRIPEAGLVGAYGGRTVVAAQARGASTTNLIRRIVRRYRPR